MRNKEVVRAMHKFIDSPSFDNLHEVRQTSFTEKSCPCGAINKYFGPCDSCVLSLPAITLETRNETHCICDLISSNASNDGFASRKSHFDSVVKQHWKKLKATFLLQFVVFLEIEKERKEEAK